jgi:hypothetical protein
MQVLEMSVEELAITLSAFKAGELRVAKVSQAGVVFPAIVIN